MAIERMLEIDYPEKMWEDFKNEVYCPDSRICSHVERGMLESEDDEEKWAKLAATFALLVRHVITIHKINSL